VLLDVIKIDCAGVIMNWANSFAPFGLLAPLMMALREETKNAPSLG